MEEQTLKLALPGNPTVLVVEDEVMVRFVVAEELREIGFTVIEASNADEALGVLATGMPIDVVVSDVVMPGSINGIELAKRVKAEFPHIGLLLTSGNYLESDVQGIAPLVRKPYRIETLV